MSRANDFLNQNFDDDEEEDDDFNPAPVETSDNEDGNDHKQSNNREGRRRSSEAENSEDGRRYSSPRANGGYKYEDEADDDLEENGEDEKPARRRSDPEEDEDLDDEDNEGEDDDDDEDDDGEAVRPRKRRRKGGMNQFFEEEAEVDEEDDAEDEEDDLGVDGFVADTHPDDLAALPDGAERDDRRHRELDRRREVEASMDAERQAQELKERYGRRTAASKESMVTDRRLMLPSVNDPNIWGVKTAIGKEKEVVQSLMKRVREGRARILSAFERSGTPMANYVYVEAVKKADVDDALEGVMNAYPRSKMVLVPVKEMPDLLRVTKTEELNVGGWVRVKKGLYEGDLAQIEDVESNGLTITVKIVPRLDYGQHDDFKRPAPPIIDGKRKRPMASATNRPPPRLFNESEAKKKHGKFLTTSAGLSGKSFNYMGNQYEDGFLIKELKIQNVITKDVNPKLDEVTRFAQSAADGSESLDLESLAQSLKNSTNQNSYLPGDHVEVYEGEQRGVTGKTVSVQGDIVTLKVEEGELAGQTIDVPVKGLRKRFRKGDHVKVIGGSRWRDEVGMVVRINDDKVTVLSDMSMQELTVFSKDLREAADSGVDGRLGKYDVQDLVQLDPSTVGCVLKVDRESMRVLDQNGSVRSVLPSQISNKVDPRKDAIATDGDGQEIRYGDTVRERFGEQRRGTVLHMHRGFIFIHNRTQTENSGIFVARQGNVQTVASKTGRIGATDLTKLNPALQKNGANGTNGAMPPPKTIGRDRLLGKTVTIRKGPYKSMLGIVKDTTDTVARIELHSKAKVISVEKEALSVKDPVTGQTMDLSRFGGRGFGPGGNRTPMHGGSTPSRVPAAWDSGAGGRTPMGVGDGGRTPAWGASSSARTPAWGGASSNGGMSSSSRTPAWRPSGSQTSYGGATSYGGPTTASGGRTPAWSSSSRTPYGGSHGYSDNNSSSAFDTFAAGSRTPAYSGPSSHNTPQTGSRTPAWAPTPADTSSSSRPYDAPTPANPRGNDFSTPYASAPTPAASAPTPRFAENAPTPRGWDNSAAPTPSAGGGPGGSGPGHKYDAPTPAAAGGGGGGSAPTPAASGGYGAAAPTPAPYGGAGGGGGSGYGIDAPTPAAGGGDGPRYIDSDEE